MTGQAGGNIRHGEQVPAVAKDFVDHIIEFTFGPNIHQGSGHRIGREEWNVQGSQMDQPCNRDRLGISSW